ncbi:MAG: VWA domain-containing protein [Vicinamibacterales bacterium]
MNVVFALDMSESVSGRTLDALRHGVDAVARGLRTGDQTALVTFNHRVSLGAALSADVSRLTAALSSIAPTGATSLVDALYASLWIAEPDPGRAVVIVFSDGVDTASWLTADRVVDAARRADAVVYAVTTRGGRRNPFLAELTETTGGRTFDVSSSDRLTDAFESILAEFRQRYVIAYSPTGVKAAGWHTLDLRVRGRRASVKTRQGYLAGPN